MELAKKRVVCGTGGCLFIIDSHLIVLKAGLGRGSNNHSELMALKLLLRSAGDQRISQLQLYQDPELVANWMKGS